MEIWIWKKEWRGLEIVSKWIKNKYNVFKIKTMYCMVQNIRRNEMHDKNSIKDQRGNGRRLFQDSFDV